MKKLNKGFTLIELMITVAIIGILASIAMPSYLEYIARSKRADAKVGLLGLQLAQEKYRANCVQYASGISSTMGCGFLGFNLIGSTTSPDDYYTLAITLANATAYSLTATPKSPHSDSKCGTFTINQSGDKTATGDDDYCWGK